MSNDDTKRIISKSILQDTADAIRVKLGTSNPIAPVDFATNIGNIVSGGEGSAKTNNMKQSFNVASSSTWEEIPSWSGLGLYGADVWSDGEDIYCSDWSYEDYGTWVQKTYKFNKSTETWTKHDFVSVGSFGTYRGIKGRYVWNDGTNIYCSYFGTTYKFDKANNIWNIHTFTNTPNNLEGDFIWTDGSRVYHTTTVNSAGISHYLDIANNTWVSISLSSSSTDPYIAGNCVWQAGGEIYGAIYSSARLDYYYYFNTNTNRWINAYWNNASNFYAPDIWTDGSKLYMSTNYNGTYYHYYYQPSILNWITTSWSGLTNFNGQNVWTCDDKIYFMNGGSGWKLTKKSVDSRCKPVVTLS